MSDTTCHRRHPRTRHTYDLLQLPPPLPPSQTLKQRFIDQRGPLLNESLMWRVLTQLLSGLRVVHAKVRNF